ncbi:unnamed protein product [Paramecium octaurelia]|uniref:Uncharacterized protein n=1 Tax=Paramecium octaurelia TaxID=43137 RepID=A0A8S1TW55_PAROT|nr:unnamed protein product [Paramecium octaurelia]
MMFIQRNQNSQNLGSLILNQLKELYSLIKSTLKAEGPQKIGNFKVVLLQFCLPAPKKDVENSIAIYDYTEMNKILKEERKYIIDLVQKWGKYIIDSKNKTRNYGCERYQKRGCSICIQELLGVPSQSKASTILVRESNTLVLDEADRSIPDPLYVIKSLVKSKGLIPGGGAPEIHLSLKLTQKANKLTGARSMCVRAFAEAIEVNSFTFAEKQVIYIQTEGLNPIKLFTELRNRHLKSKSSQEQEQRKIALQMILQLNNNKECFELATKCVRLILKIEDPVISAC